MRAGNSNYLIHSFFLESIGFFFCCCLCVEVCSGTKAQDMNMNLAFMPIDCIFYGGYSYDLFMVLDTDGTRQRTEVINESGCQLAIPRIKCFFLSIF